MENSGTEHDAFKTGILLIVFNRLDAAKQVFERIKMMKPERLYIASDGPRLAVQDDLIKVNATREYLLANINWPCEVFTLFRDVNLGCGKNVKLSIDWFFENEDYGIILEDDCLPATSFFKYCEELLIKYATDQRVGMISGTNHYSRFYSIEESYLFSKYKSCWGWATWKRSWMNMDFEMNWLNTNKKRTILKNMGYGIVSYYHWKNALKKIENGIVDTWDWQWYFSLAAQNQLCVFPRKNLISNIGFGREATHTFGKAKDSYTQVDTINFPLRHPKYVVVDKKFDAIFEAKKLRKQILLDLFPQSVKNFVKRNLIAR